MRRAFSKPTSSDAELETLLTTYRAQGYEGLQLKIGQYLPWLDDVDGFLERFGDDRGSVSYLIHFDTLEPEGIERLDATIRFAERVGSESVVFCHNHTRKGVDRELLTHFAGLISDMGAKARRRGVALSLHHHFDQPVMHPEDFDVFFGAIEPRSVGLTVDTAHLAKSGITDIPGFVRQYADIIDNVHFKDYDGTQWRLLGEGDLDLTGILTALADSGYDGWLCVDEESTADLETGFRVSREWLDREAITASRP